MDKKHKKKGFTVLELIIVVTLTAVLLGVVVSMVNIASNMIRYSDNKSTLQRQAQIIQEKFSYIGMQAKNFYKEDNVYVIEDIEGTKYKITLNKIEGQNNQFSDILVNGDMYVDGDKKNITIIDFIADINNNVVNISFKLEKGNNKNKVTYPVNITFFLRNN